MKLYYAPGACSLSPHIVAREAGLAVELEKVDLRSHQTTGGGDFYAVNPKGYVPVLELDDGRRLTEGAAIVQYLADQTASRGLAPEAGTFERYQLQEWLSFIGNEIHKQFGPLFKPDTPEATRTANLAKIAERLAWVAKDLGDRAYLMGETFTVADAYLFVMLRWAKGKQQLGPVLDAYFDRVSKRPAVQTALREEELARA
jgi:glutathione S-transferase